MGRLATAKKHIACTCCRASFAALVLLPPLRRRGHPRGVHSSSSLSLAADAQVDERFAHQLKEEEAAPETMSQSKLAGMKGRIAAMLGEDETVLKALKRLGSKEALASAAGKKAFEELTELASTLMANGEYEVNIPAPRS